MSYRIAPLQYTSVPAVASDFDVIIPGLAGTAAFRCEVAEVHHPDVLTNTMSYCGQVITLPTDKKKVSGSITLILQEDWAFSTYRCLRVLYPHFKGMLTEGDPQLHDVKIKLSSRFPMSAAIPADYLNKGFTLDDSEQGPLVLSSMGIKDGSIWVNYKNAFLQSIAPMRLDWSKPGDALKWQVTFVYNVVDIEDERDAYYNKMFGAESIDKVKSWLKSISMKDGLDKFMSMRKANLIASEASAEYLAMAAFNTKLGAVGRVTSDILTGVSSL